VPHSLILVPLILVPLILVPLILVPLTLIPQVRATPTRERQVAGLDRTSGHLPER
jgi:hypothetical protein